MRTLPRAIAVVCCFALTACSKRSDREEKAAPPRPAAPWMNSLGMRFAPVEGTPALFSVYETRMKEFECFVGETKNDWIGPDLSVTPEHPAVNVTWDDAAAFCEWLTRRERVARILGPQQRYRLPTDAEWSLAAGISDESGATPAEKGDTPLLHHAWGSTWPPPAGQGNFAGEEAPVDRSEKELFIAGYRDDFERLAPVGKFSPNRFGLHDLVGNAMEWCSDWFDATHRGRVARGGSWLSGDPRSLSSSHRAEIPPRAGLDVTGFRCVLEL